MPKLRNTVKIKKLGQVRAETNLRFSIDKLNKSGYNKYRGTPMTVASL